MEDNDAPDAEARDALEEGISLNIFARIGAPAIFFSPLATIADLAFDSDPKATYQILVPSKEAYFGLIFSVVNAAKMSNGSHSDGRSITATNTTSFVSDGIDSKELDEGLSDPRDTEACVGPV